MEQNYDYWDQSMIVNCVPEPDELNAIISDEMREEVEHYYYQFMLDEYYGTL